MADDVLSGAPWRGRKPDNQFYGYYISFDATGCEPVDEILRAVSMAAKGYHHTEGWSETHDDGKSYLDWIQVAANEAARKFKGASDGE
jgi:hypothetical protein